MTVADNNPPWIRGSSRADPVLSRNRTITLVGNHSCLSRDHMTLCRSQRCSRREDDVPCVCLPRQWYAAQYSLSHTHTSSHKYGLEPSPRASCSRFRDGPYDPAGALAATRRPSALALPAGGRMSPPPPPPPGCPSICRRTAAAASNSRPCGMEASQHLSGRSGAQIS